MGFRLQMHCGKRCRMEYKPGMTCMVLVEVRRAMLEKKSRHGSSWKLVHDDSWGCLKCLRSWQVSRHRKRHIARTTPSCLLGQGRHSLRRLVTPRRTSQPLDQL